MAKRKVIAESDDEEQIDASQNSKRARTEDSDGEPEYAQTQTPRREKKPSVNGKGKGKARDDDSDDDAYGGEKPSDEQNEEEEKQFEEENGERIRQQIEQKRNTYGGIADHGIIESIEMHQFMCHRFLTFTFGPQINFIIGHNGSGKSAVLSAITIALGGKSTSTGRGNGLKSFIREGQPAAEVTISLKNQGEEAYKPKEYGKSIVVTRKFTREGSSSWKIKSKDGKVVSTKKDELSAICDHMNIQVDNPMNVLTQDAARQFLSASHPSDKYKFFLRGTQLSQLSDEYDTCLENINQTKKVLHQKRQVIPDLEATFKEVSIRFNEANKAREQRFKADELKKELAWAHVAAKQEEMEAKLLDVAKLKRRLPKIQAEVNTAKSQFQLASEEVGRYEAELGELGNIDHLNTQRHDLNEKMRVNKRQLSNYNTEEKEMNTSLVAVNRQIATYDERILEETRKMESHTQAKREETTRKLEVAKEAVRVAEEAQKAILDQKRQKLEEQAETGKRGQAAEQAKKDLQGRITECQTMIMRCKEQEKNSLSAYGRDIKGVLAQIAQMNWKGEVPVGPLGTHVKLKDQFWAPLMRTQLGGLMTAFACTDPRDRPQLKSLLERTGNQHVTIIIAGRDMYDYSSGEPPESVLTVLRVLEISDPYVLRVLINQSGIERTVVARTRLEAQDTLTRLGGNGVAWTADWMRVHTYSDGGGQSIKLPPVATGDSKNLLFTSNVGGTELGRWQDRLTQAEAEYKTAIDDYGQLRQAYNDLTRAVNSFNGQERSAFETLRAAKNEHKALQDEANEEMPTSITGLEAAKEDAVKEKASILEQFTDLTEKKTEINKEQNALLADMNKIRDQIKNFEEKRIVIAAKVDDAVKLRLEAQTNEGHYNAKLEKDEREVKDAETIATQLQTEFADWTARAEEYCDKFENPRKVEEVERSLKSVQAALKERERRHGATVEEMTIEVNKARADLDNAMRDLTSLNSLNNVLRKSLVIRLSKWQEFRRHIALRCKLVFQYHLSNRGYYGKVLFDHQNQTLQLKVQTDDQAATQGSRDKDPRSLSGGEKSFSTICLLLSLWDSIGCPLRCLDEFDVFMDAVNRRISMRMMIDTANASDKKQYILITPQDMGNIHVGQTVRVHRMSDPERGQGTLEFGN
ncbi:P-loop containing nucleoside triphosphate hydrolase protein [Leucogyrophana mollusca]|uniref:P-loop containing nucleoside triphosphate hydrolase protein n=1 Tax=Leucogyrophana mollusca TaxID=85980 RepID=A0ACB8B4A8_9AGAM|nr:P-loop containing nucleoside triphosphate hydrolase protein [Leucogyrophana mollusca]